MNELIFLSLQSLWNRRVTSSLTVVSIALGFSLLLGIERVQSGVRESFSQTISHTDLIVGARGGGLSLLLYSVFHLGNATNNISIESYDRFRNHPSVAWTIPISLGDSHRGFRVVSTDRNFLDHYAYAGGRRLQVESGHWGDSLFDVVLGSDVAEKLHYAIGDSVVVAHGTAEVSFHQHEKSPFHVVGILARTLTPVDSALYVSLEAMEAIHVDWEGGVPSQKEQSLLTADRLRPKQITAFFLATKERIESLRLQREINDYDGEPLLAILPASTLQELWRMLGYAESALRLVAFVVVLVSLLGMLMSLYTTLNERRREFSILRALGASPGVILRLFLLETIFLTAAGCLWGTILLYGGLFFLRPLIEARFGVTLPVHGFSGSDFVYFGIELFLGALAGLFLGIRANRHSLIDGLQVRV